MDLTAEFLKEVLKLGNPTHEAIGGKIYAIGVDGVPKPLVHPLPETLALHTLSSLSDYLKENPDELDLAKILVHVRDELSVSVLSVAEGQWLEKRRYFVSAKSERPTFRFGEWQGQELFIIALMTHFDDTPERAKLVKLVGNLKDGQTVVQQDDGMTQMVTAQTGVSTVARKNAEPLVKLRAHRTFAEIVQPSAEYLFRLRSGVAEGSPPQLALFETDGGAWKLEAIESIKKWLVEGLPKQVVTLA